MKLVRTSLCGLGAVAFFFACSSSDTPTSSAGLALTVATDGSVTPDRVSVKVASASTVFFQNDLALGTSPLPTTVNVDASGTATVVVQAWSGATPLDRRDLSLAALPTNATASYTVVLSARCSGHVRAAADGSIASDCAAGTTCDPTTGACGSANVTPQITNDGGVACSAGATRCSADGLSVETCSADSATWGASASCNGKTCAGGACTTCNVGDSSCASTACKAGDRRCSATAALNVEECDATGAWKRVDTCPYVCKAGQCTGECTPGTLGCCQDDVTAGGKVRNCKASISTCVGGVGCADPHPTAIYLTACDADGHVQVALDCYNNGGVVSGAPGSETNVAACGSCETTQKPSCLHADTNSCVAH